MNIDEYYKQRDALIAKHKKELHELIFQCAMDNNTVEVGDIIADGTSRIKVEYITPYLSLESVPMCKYKGLRVKKNLKPFINAEVADVYQKNITEVIHHD